MWLFDQTSCRSSLSIRLRVDRAFRPDLVSVVLGLPFDLVFLDVSSFDRGSDLSLRTWILQTLLRDSRPVTPFLPHPCSRGEVPPTILYIVELLTRTQLVSRSSSFRQAPCHRPYLDLSVAAFSSCVVVPCSPLLTTGTERHAVQAASLYAVLCCAFPSLARD